MAGELGDGSRQLDTRRTAADDHKGQYLALYLRGVGVFRLLEGEQQAVADAGSIVDLLQARRERSPFVMPEIAVAGAGRDHEIVVRNPGIPQDHLAHCGIDVGYLAEQDTNVGLIAKQCADGSGDVGRGKAGSGYLVEQRLE